MHYGVKAILTHRSLIAGKESTDLNYILSIFLKVNSGPGLRLSIEMVNKNSYTHLKCWVNLVG